MSKLNLVVLRSADADAARGFYECLGMSFEHHRHGDGPGHHATELDGTVLEIYPVSLGGEPDTAGLGFCVNDLKATADRLNDSGFTPGEIAERPWGTTFVVRDSDGRRVEVQQDQELS